MQIPLAALSQFSMSTVAGSGAGADVAQLRAVDRFGADHRATLVDAVHDDLLRWGAPASAVDAAEELRQTGSYAVVTGQQAGVATGPLYTIYKALGAVLHAAELRRRHPEHAFVPVFWIEGDDHDFDEARSIGLIDRSGAARSIAYDDGDQAPRHVGDRPVPTEALHRLTQELRDTLVATEFTDEMIGLVEGAYGMDGATLADGFARSLYAILGDTPLVLVSSRNARLKGLASDVFAAEVEDPMSLYATVASRSDELRGAGLPTPIAPKPGALFLTQEGQRRALSVENGAYALPSAGLDSGALLELARSAPERFSPNVVLRPIVQDAIFPTAAYIGGPSELAYLVQVSAGYDRFGLEPPEFVARPFALLLEKKARRTLDAGAASLEDLLSETFDAAACVVDTEAAARIDEAQASAIGGIASALGGFGPITTSVDPTLEKALGAARAAAEKAVDDFTRKLRAALKRKSQTEIDRLQSARELVMPAGRLQERFLNPLYFINKYGLEALRAALENLETREGVMQVVEIGASK